MLGVGSYPCTPHHSCYQGLQKEYRFITNLSVCCRSCHIYHFCSQFTPRSARGKPISSPRLTSSSEGTITMTPLPYKSSMPHSPNKSMRSIDDSDYDATSEFSQHESAIPYSYQIEPIVLGSLSDFGPPTPSTIVISPQEVINVRPQTPFSPPSPLTPPPTHPALRAAAGYQSPTSPRPFTYPSNDPQHRNFAN